MAKAKTTAQKVKWLEHQVHLTGETIYARLKVAAEVLEDRDYIVSEHEGGYGQCYDMIEGYFPDLCGVLGTTLDGLLAVLKEYPGKKVWAFEGFDIGRMLAKHNEEAKSIDASRRELLAKAGSNGKPNQRRRVEMKDYKRVEKHNTRLVNENQTAKRGLTEAAEQVKDLRAENAKLRKELEEVTVERDRLQLIVLGITEAVGASG